MQNPNPNPNPSPNPNPNPNLNLLGDEGVQSDARQQVRRQLLRHLRQAGPVDLGRVRVRLRLRVRVRVRVRVRPGRPGEGSA